MEMGELSSSKIAGWNESAHSLALFQIYKWLQNINYDVNEYGGNDEIRC